MRIPGLTSIVTKSHHSYTSIEDIQLCKYELLETASALDGALTELNNQFDLLKNIQAVKASKYRSAAIEDLFGNDIYTASTEGIVSAIGDALNKVWEYIKSLFGKLVDLLEKGLGHLVGDLDIIVGKSVRDKLPIFSAVDGQLVDLINVCTRIIEFSKIANNNTPFDKAIDDITGVMESAGWENITSHPKPKELPEKEGTLFELGWTVSNFNHMVDQLGLLKRNAANIAANITRRVRFESDIEGERGDRFKSMTRLVSAVSLVVTTHASKISVWHTKVRQHYSKAM